VPLFYIHSLGFYSHFSVCLPPSYPVVETHPDPTTTTELRLTNPWPELLALAKEKTSGLKEMNDHDHGHVPYVLLLLHYLEVWKQQNSGRVPSTYREKQEFRKLVEKNARADNAEGGEENFEEAAKAVLKSLNPVTLGRNVQAIFQAEECNMLTKDVCGPHPASLNGTYTLVANQFRGTVSSILDNRIRNKGFPYQTPGPPATWLGPGHESPIGRLYPSPERIQGQSPPRRR
jgi:hypothetical protein